MLTRYRHLTIPIKVLKTKFNISLPGDAGQHINQFELFNNDPGAKIGGTLLINQSDINCYLNFIKSRFSYSYGGRGGKGGQSFTYDKYQVWAFVTLSRDFGRILIRRETFADRILGIVHPVELKFKDDKVFSEHFYVVTNDKEKAPAAMTSDFRNIIKEMMYKNFVIEIIGSILVIRDNQPIDPQEVIHMTELACKIAELR
ncbi:MAG: hypothetical protein JWP78_2665 [Mucilaginibacter sp.]|nr:hypothetical protein [Mucilaginibacter sp.]